MNKERRKAIVHALEMINKARSILEQVRDEENDAYENMPASLQESDRGITMQDGLDALSETIDDLENIDLANHFQLDA